MFKPPGLGYLLRQPQSTHTPEDQPHPPTVPGIGSSPSTDHGAKTASPTSTLDARESTAHNLVSLSTSHRGLDEYAHMCVEGTGPSGCLALDITASPSYRLSHTNTRWCQKRATELEPGGRDTPCQHSLQPPCRALPAPGTRGAETVVTADLSVKDVCQLPLPLSEEKLALQLVGLLL